jgi:hypothetical protein
MDFLLGKTLLGFSSLLHTPPPLFATFIHSFTLFGRWSFSSLLTDLAVAQTVQPGPPVSFRIVTHCVSGMSTACRRVLFFFRALLLAWFRVCFLFLLHCIMGHWAYITTWDRFWVWGFRRLEWVIDDVWFGVHSRVASSRQRNETAAKIYVRIRLWC